MKEVTIRSKIVGREGSGTGIPSPSSPSASVDLSLYLKKEVWDDAFELKETEDGVPYLFGKLPVLLQYGLTMYADSGHVSVPSLFDGIPIDNSTIYWDETTNADGSVTRVLKAKGVGGEGGSADFGNVLESGTGNAFTSFSISDDGKELTLVKGETFAKQTDLNSLSTKLTDFLEGSDTDNIINKWKELEAFLSGMSESSDLADILSGKADKGTTLEDYGITDAYTDIEVDKLLEKYLPLTGGTVTGDLRLRTGSEYTSPYLYFGDSDEVYLKEATDQYLTIHADKGIVLDTPLTTIDGIEIKKSAEGVLYIDANLVVSGGITMYGTDGTTSSSIWDGAPIASTSVKGIASFDSEFFAVSNGKVTFIGETGGGGIESITKQMVIDALGYTPYNNTNPSGYISGITKTMVTTALGYTPYNSTNPNGFITGITKSMVTSALGYTPYDSTNPNGYVTSSGSVANATTASKLSTVSKTAWGKTYWTSGGVPTSISGDMTGVGSITMDGNLQMANANSVKLANASGSYKNVMSMDASNNFCLGFESSASGYDTYIDGYNIYLRTGSSHTKRVTINSSGSVVGNYWKVNDTSTNPYLQLTQGSDWLIQGYNGYLYLGAGRTKSLRVSSDGSCLTPSSMTCSSFYINSSTGAGDGYSLYSTQAPSVYGILMGTKANYGSHGGVTGGWATYFCMNGNNEARGWIFRNSYNSTNVASITTNGDLLVNGGITMYSDERKKTILNHVELSLKEVAEAPLIEHYYNSDEKKTTHVGSIAQYWAGLNDWFCKKDDKGFYMMEIQNAALASAISVAREVVRLKEHIRELESEIEKLKTA